MKELIIRQVLDMGTRQIQVIHTPGHTPGSVCYLIRGNLFAGDTWKRVEKRKEGQYISLKVHTGRKKTYFWPKIITYILGGTLIL